MFNNILKDQSLQGRLMSAFIFMGLLVFVVALIGLIMALRLSGHVNTIGNNNLPSVKGLWMVNEAQTQIESSERAFLILDLNTRERLEELGRIEKAWEQIDEGFKKYENTPRTPEEEKIYQELQSNWDKWQQDHRAFLRLAEQFDNLGILNPYQAELILWQQDKQNSDEMGKVKQAAQLLAQLYDLSRDHRVTFEAGTASLREDIDYNANFAANATKAALADSNLAKTWSIIGLLIGPVTAYFLGRYFVNSITKPLGAKIAGVVDVAQKISEGDLTTQVQPSEQEDEIGKLQSAFYVMNRDLNNLLRRIQSSGVQITTATTQISASGKQLEGMVTEQQASTNEVTATAHEIAATAKNLVKTLEQVIDQAQMTANAARNSQDELQDMESTMLQLTKATHSITSKLGIMNKKAGNISNVVVTITKVADQTSILSLNAAIEAEKAGEYGAGFAVVAREIRRLANQTAVATLEIEQIVKDMQSAVAVGVMEMDKFSKSVSDSVERVNKISNQIADVIEQVQSLPPQFMQVGQGMDEQAQGAQQISESMGQLSEASYQTVESLQDTNNALLRLDNAAALLREEISRFKVQND
ncbi:MAG: methyl-accepting chemotaxis protein [Microcystaceae cyanobacterium]